MNITLISACFATGGAHGSAKRGPFVYRQRTAQSRGGRDGGIIWQWTSQLQPWPQGQKIILQSCRQLSRRVARQRLSALPLIIGGDHSCAIGTWHGVVPAQQTIGLLWIDAHFDSHSPDTTESFRIHGMPLAVLLGEGDPLLVGGRSAVIDKAYCVVFGVRSYEAGELARIQRLGIRFYDMAEIQRRGLSVCLREAWRLVSSCPQGFGVSLDLDSLDPTDAPAVSVPEQRGLRLKALAQTLHCLPKHRLRAVEIVEFNPSLDRQRRTWRALTTLIETLTGG